MKDDLISRAAAIECVYGSSPNKIKGRIAELPSAQPKYDEWCTDCKEYDNERHCCPRWNRVIRQTIDDMKAAQPGEDIRAMCGECDAWNQYKNYPQPGWIPTSERTPEKSGMYLVTTPDGQVELRYYSTLYRWYGWVDMVAWQPLPTPYLEGEKL